MEKFSIDWDKKLPNFILDESSELILFTYNNIFQIANQTYLFRYKIGEFEKNLRNNNQDILDILSKENLNRIIVIKQNITEYMRIFFLLHIIKAFFI